MAGEQDAARGGGTAGTGQGESGAKPEGGQPASPPASGAGAGGAGKPTGDAGGAGKPVGISPDILPKELQGRSEAEIKFVLANMVSSLQKQNQRIKELEGKGGTPAEEKPKAEEKPVKPLEERILEDPEGVIDEVVRKRYGSVIQSLESGVGSSVLSAVRSEVDDFKEHEDDVLDLLTEAGLPKTRENLLGAYTQVVGMKTLEERRQQKQQNIGIESGGGRPADEDKSKPKLTELEDEIRIAHGMSVEDWHKYRSDEVVSSIRVPTGKREKQDA